MNQKGVCRTAPATQGLVNTLAMPAIHHVCIAPLRGKLEVGTTDT